jgi:hypothetical protein
LAGLVQILDFLRVRKRFWLPIVVITLIFAGLLLLSEGNALTPFVYRRL